MIFACVWIEPPLQKGRCGGEDHERNTNGRDQQTHNLPNRADTKSRLPERYRNDGRMPYHDDIREYQSGTNQRKKVETGLLAELELCSQRMGVSVAHQ